MLKPILDFVASLLVKLAGPLAAFFAGKEHQEKKDMEHENETLKKNAAIDAAPPDSPDNVISWLRGGDDK